MKSHPIQTINTSEMRAINRCAILELIRASGPISRTEIGSRLGVSLPTVMRIVDALIGDGLVRPAEDGEWTGGRKRAEVEFNGAAHLVIGLDLGGTKLYGAVSDLNGQILQETTLAHHQTRSEESFQLIGDLIDRLKGYIDQTGLALWGIGVGVPGVTDPRSGRVALAPALDWFGFPLRQRLSERYAYPIVVENDANLAALGEVWFGPDADVENLALVAVGTGIGAGIVINGNIYSGAHALAGEVGYLLPDRSHLGRSYPGFGALEMLASGTGIVERARQALQGHRSPEELEAITAEGVFKAARSGEAWAGRVVDETVDTLAQAIAAITQIIDPDLILLGGGVSRSADLLIEPILQRLQGAIPRLPRLEVARLGYRAAVLGAVMMLLRMTSHYYSIKTY